MKSQTILLLLVAWAHFIKTNYSSIMMWHKKEAFVQDFSSPGINWMLDLRSNGNNHYLHQFRYKGEVKHPLLMTSHGNINSVLPLQPGVHIWPWALVHPSCLIPVCSCCSLHWSKHFSPAWEYSQTWCLQGAQTQLAQAMDVQEFPTPALCRGSWQILAGLEVLPPDRSF